MSIVGWCIEYRENIEIVKVQDASETRLDASWGVGVGRSIKGPITRFEILSLTCKSHTAKSTCYLGDYLRLTSLDSEEVFTHILLVT